MKKFTTTEMFVVVAILVILGLMLASPIMKSYEKQKEKNAEENNYSTP